MGVLRRSKRLAVFKRIDCHEVMESTVKKVIIKKYEHELFKAWGAHLKDGSILKRFNFQRYSAINQVQPGDKAEPVDQECVRQDAPVGVSHAVCVGKTDSCQ